MAKTEYRVIVKVSNDKFVKYHSNNLSSFVTFVNKKFKNWRYMNIFEKHTRNQIGSITSSGQVIGDIKL